MQIVGANFDFKAKLPIFVDKYRLESRMEPLFTIITVTYNAAETIGRTIESVDSQTFKIYEHLIIDGCSKDATLDIVARHSNPLRVVLSEPDKGLYDAMNKGIGRAKGDYLIFLNAGDKFHSADTLRHLADLVVDNDKPGILYGQTDIVDNNGVRLGDRHLKAPEALTLKSFSKGMLVCHQAFIPLRRIVGMYNLKYRYSADYEWCIRCLQHSRRNVYAGEVLIDYLSEGLTTANRRKSLKERFDIMCYYYGTLPTLVRHIGFFFRRLRQARKEKRQQTIKN